MNISIQNNLKAVDVFYIILALTTYLFIHYTLLVKQADATLLLVGLNLIVVFVVLSSVFIKNLKVLLLLINLIPLFYVSVSLHYLIKNVIIQDLPLFIFLVLAIFTSLRNAKTISIRFSYFSTPIILMLLYAIFMALVGVLNGYNKIYILDEFYHLLYYPLGLAIYYLIKDDRAYKWLIGFIIFFILFFSLENIYMNLFSGRVRFVTFQSYISPIIIGILFSSILLPQNKKSVKQILLAIIFLAVFSGMTITMTRSLWISMAITLGIVSFIYLWKEKKIKLYKLALISIIIFLPMIFYLMSQKSVESKGEKYYDVEYRTASMANPEEDASFLMRMEIGYYAFQKFLESPIWGRGFGDSVQYKFMLDIKNDIIYPDNSWLFFLWKGGIIGLFIFGWIYYRWLKTLYLIYRKSNKIYTKAIVLGIFGGLIGMIVFGLFNAVLIKYKSLTILSILIAYTMNEHSKLTEIES